jgi:hypothetical protein
MLAALIATRLFIFATPLPNASLGVPYSVLLMGGGGTMPYTWTISAGSLPPGLTLNSATGQISGTPTTLGTFIFTVLLTDAMGATATHVFTLTVVSVMYGNQFVAATTTFSCISLTKAAVSISTSPTFSYQLSYSAQGAESILSQLNRGYDSLISENATNDPVFLSNTIIQMIEVVTTLNGVVQSLPVAMTNLIALAEIQRRTALALRILRSLSIPITLDFA